MQTRKKTISIGNAGGYWGDDTTALRRQVNGGRLDYVSIDFLAEITMSIMQKQRSREPLAGYARDFLPMLEEVLGQLLERKTKIITNAGGVNPEGCAEGILQLAQKLGLRVKVGVVSGDDILPDLAAMRGKGIAFDNMESGEKFSQVEGRVLAANVYFGAWPVVEALKHEPDIIVTGRVTDTGITLAPMIHEFGWAANDWDKLAAGIVAGHMIECGAQSTGGNFTDWHRVKSFENVGYPIVEVSDSGAFVLTKHPATGGLVSVDTTREQLFYEMGSPTAYITPDVVADFSSIQLQQAGEDRVAVSGIRGFEPTPLYKVSMAYGDGFKTQGSILVCGPDARNKATIFSELFWQRCKDLKLTERMTEYVGWNACHGSLGHESDGNEVILKLAARADSQEPLRKLGKIIPGLILSGPPGVAVLGGAAKPQEVVSYWPALMPKTAVKPKITIMGNGTPSVFASELTPSGNFVEPPHDFQVAHTASAGLKTCLAAYEQSNAVPLSAICLGRSGDKGDTCNIGVIARSKAAYDFLEQHLTAQLVKNWFQELCLGAVTRHSVPNLQGFNFLLEQALGGGGTKTLRSDAQGKTFAQALLRQRLAIPLAVLQSVQASDNDG